MKTNRFRKMISLFFAVIIISTVYYISYNADRVSAEEEQYLVPDVRGKTLDEAVQMIYAASLSPGNTIEVETHNPAEDKIVKDTDPVAGQSLPRDGLVTIYVYAYYGAPAPATHVVPDISRMTQENAQQALSENGFSCTFAEEETSDSSLNGHVVRTDPAIGTDAPLGSTITVYLGKYTPRMLTVPNVINMTEQAVRQSLTENGFVCNIAYEETDDQSKNGLVLRTDPAIGTTNVPEGTTVTAFLGKYVPKKVAVPDVIGKTIDEAKEIITNAKLTPTIVETKTDTEDLDKNVFRQDPSAGAELDEGGGVVLHVYIYEAPETSESEPDSDDEEFINIDGYKIYKNLRGVSAPKNFMAVSDSSTFKEPIDAFYSTSYGTYLYYAEKDGTDDYFLYDKDRNTMFRYVPLADPDGNSFIAAVPQDKQEIADSLIGTTEVDLGTMSNPLKVPAWLIRMPDGQTATVLYLLKSNSTSGFYVYENTDGITLTPLDEFKKDHKGDSEDSEKSSSVEPVTEEPTKSDSDKEPGFFRQNLIWVVIISAILLLIIIAVFVVFKMSRRQEEMEYQEDLRERAAQQEKNRPGKKYDSSYTNNTTEELEPFDISFENAFPDELGLNKKPQRTERRQDVDFVGRDGMLKENAFEDLDKSLNEADARYDGYREPENRDYIEPKDFGTGHARPKRPVRPGSEDILPEDVDEPAPSETIYTKKSKARSEYQELLEDDFEVVDFRKKQ